VNTALYDEGYVLTSIDENTRRYYLDVMGIQCWQQLGDDQSAPPAEQSLENNQLVNASTDAAVNWSQLETSIGQCELCSLHQTRNELTSNISVAGTGNKNSSLMFVVLSPGAQGVLLSDRANALFEKMLAAINISIDEVYLSSLLKCSVPENHTISAQEIASCRQFLKQQIQLVQPKQLVVLGDTAVRCLLQKNLSIDDLRDSCNQSQISIEDVSLSVSYSPEELLLQPENKRKAWNDLQRLQKIMAAD